MKKFVLLILSAFILFSTSSAAIFTVTNTTDNNTSGTFRWAIAQANLTAAKDTINFSVAGTWTVLNANGNYPTITYPLCINGFTATGAVQGQLGTGLRQLKVIMNGPGNGTINGLTITANNCEIKGLVIQNFFLGIYINGSAATNNWIWGCYIGTAADGLSASSTTSCFDDGVRIDLNSSNNIIGTNGDGGNDANEGNLISGNGDGGTQFQGEGIAINEGSSGSPGTIGTNCSGNRIAGNYLGVNETGSSALYTNPTADAQRGSGVQINYSTANIIGTNGDGVSDALERNIISGNSDCGIVIKGGSGNKIKGNYIGTNKTGLIGIPNYANGGTKIAATAIAINASNSNYIGTDGDGANDNIEGNIVGSATIAAGSFGSSYNYGVFISGSTGNKVSGNKIGIGADGITALTFATTSGPYVDKGVYIKLGSTNTIVGTNGDGVSDAYETNYFGNCGSGVTIDNSNSCIVAGNYFGLGTDLTTAESITHNSLPSTGVYILNSTTCRVGSSASNLLERNYFCNITYDGVFVDGNVSTNNDLNNIRYNVFGIRPDGVDAPNGFHGVEINQQSNADTVQYNILSRNGTITPDGTYSAVLIGGPNANEESLGCVVYKNTVFKNIGRGVDILGNLSVNNRISQNSIYDNGNASNSTASTPAFGKYSLGIDLGYDGTTPNDVKDPDTGPDDYTNFPIITGAVAGSSSCNGQINGTFNGLASTQYYVEVFSSDVCNGDTASTNNYLTAGYNYGEGKTYVGTSSVFTTDASGNGTWSLSVTFSSFIGQYITATSIQNNGAGINNTSEYSQCFYVSYDCGDAPDIYHTLISNCGPVHLNVNTNLKIGSTVTIDADGIPGVLANGDVDDGISSLPALTVKTTSYSLSNIPVTNTTGSTATLYAWIDFDGDGSFEASEYTSASVANGATSATLTWNLASATCGTSLVVGTSYLRMRLTTSTLTDNAGTTTVDERSYGEASNGEVEDYKIYISGYDYGDLTNSYPVAAALCLEDTAAAKVWAGAIKPGRECTQKYSVDAFGDGTEEDGLTTNIGPSGGTYNWVVRLNSNTASKTVYYGLWIDWNGNASFTDAVDKFYSGSAVVNGVTSKNVSVTTPSTLTNSTFRLIASDAALTSGMYNATIANGEVEDFSLYRVLTVPGNILMGNKQHDGNFLSWKNTGGLQIKNYVLERSDDNTSWSEVSTVIPLSTDNSSTQYSYSDVNLSSAKNYYRLKLIFEDYSFQYSNLVVLSDKNELTPVIIYPNPASNVIRIQTSNSNYSKILVQDLTGRTEISVPINAYNTAVDISLISSGMHILKVITKDGKEQVQKFVKTK